MDRVTRLHFSAEVEALLAPTRVVLDAAAPRLPEGPELEVVLGEVEGFARREAGTLTLSRALAGPALHHPAEAGPHPPVDRWRRALGCVLEGLADASLEAALGAPPAPAWLRAGAAIALADRAAPELQLAAPDLALALSSGDLGQHPRAGVAPVLLLLRESPDLLTLLRDLAEAPLSPERWLALGAQAFHPDSPLLARLPFSPARPPARATPGALPPWSWTPLRLEHPRGGALALQGPGAVDRPWVLGGSPERALAAACGAPLTLELGPGAPVGRWALGSVSGLGPVMGARGVELELRADGRLELVLADSFVGPAEALAIAERYGTSGTAMGRWRISAPARLRMQDIVTLGLTMHSTDGMVVPADATSQGWIQQLQSTDFSWARRAEQLILRGRMMGQDVELRLRPA
ncbi:MAG: hypothetical protein H6741_11940 [Alphaproteobacteria bacterium]|nr:hypothetical protein [Alphaproteobacteria bacterium]MCB9793423.1 hypothetical protein [Alphaproteobacteria bacterium]